MKFTTSIHCMDGRIQEPIIKYLKDNYNASYVDTITEAGPCKIIAEGSATKTINSILKRTNLSIDKHGSTLIAVSGHYDCAGNPAGPKEHLKQIKKSVLFLKNTFPKIKIIGLWIDSKWQINKLSNP
ncbi:MAG: hypothetical protein K9L95_01300 [Candidatus Omnitrophica bacterium]|nr:hypothetical protein [Candidatus Omnitrophota bacterium]MCF7878091.1 hypothetical protein [Candidatus Omnitrophota bacterium]MCF7893239.1 hypothetical protein [Candidatus Omnitrophota bacterium]